MAGYGVPELGFARLIGVDPKTLRKHYRSELDLGHLKANSAVAFHTANYATFRAQMANIQQAERQPFGAFNSVSNCPTLSSTKLKFGTGPKIIAAMAT
ncbi:hypothetical protein [Mesorhizobium escarrei]|uniref:hypothetical protein n=1 Tax=Mesorhizobium escarrei TaxID=666018 RepID=UPI003F53B033